jgi:hypothetical protein
MVKSGHYEVTMSANLSVTLYALQRVLFHLSEDNQAEQPRYQTHNGAFFGRAAARVVVKRVLRSIEQDIAVAWDEAKCDKRWAEQFTPEGKLQ